MNAKIVAATPAIASVIARARLPDAKLVMLRDEAFQILETHELQYVSRLHSTQVGVHPRNRAASGIVAQEVHRKLRKLVQAGFSFEECRNAAAVEREPGEVGDGMEEKNVLLVGASDGQLASVAASSLKVFSVTCGHTNQALRVAHSGLSSTDDLVSVAGRVSVGKISDQDPNLGKAIREGLTWKVMVWQAAREWPELVDLLIDADNIPTSNMSRADTNLVVLWRILKAAREMAATHDKINWAEIVTLIQRTQDRTAVDLESMCLYVAKWSGGLETAIYLAEIDSWIKSLRVAREIPPVVIRRLAELDLGPGIGGEWRCACMKAMAACTDKWIGQAGESRYITTGDISSMQAKCKALVLVAQDMMTKARSMADDTLGLDLNVKVAVLGRLDIRLVGHVLNRPLLEKFASMAEIGHAFWVELQGAAGAAVVCPAQWLLAAPRAKDVPQPRESVVTLARDGSASVALAADRGLVVGAKVRLKTGNESIMTVTSISNTHVSIFKAAPKLATQEIALSVFFDVYVIAKGAPQDKSNRRVSHF
jgi:hypothetical protein